MSTPFQNRLVGSVIVAAAVVIFLPDLLDGEKKSHQTDFQAIPQAPAFETKHNKANDFPEQELARIAEQEVSEELAIDEENVNEQTQFQDEKPIAAPVIAEQQPAEIETKTELKTEPKTRTLPEKTVLGEAWVIHLGSFKHQKNVQQLVKKLKDNGYTVFTRPIRTRNGELTKVIIGPELNKTTMEKKIPALKKLTKVTGKLAKYNTNK